MGRTKKDEFEDLDDDFKSAIAGMDELSIRKKISEMALLQIAIAEAKANDQDLEEKKAVYEAAGAGYKEATKMGNLRIKFCRRVLSDKGKDVGTFEQD